MNQNTEEKSEGNTTPQLQNKPETNHLVPWLRPNKKKLKRAKPFDADESDFASSSEVPKSFSVSLNKEDHQKLCEQLELHGEKSPAKFLIRTLKEFDQEQLIESKLSEFELQIQARLEEQENIHQKLLDQNEQNIKRLILLQNSKTQELLNKFSEIILSERKNDQDQLQNFIDGINTNFNLTKVHTEMMIISKSIDTFADKTLNLCQFINEHTEAIDRQAELFHRDIENQNQSVSNTINLIEQNIKYLQMAIGKITLPNKILEDLNTTLKSLLNKK